MKEEGSAVDGSSVDGSVHVVEKAADLYLAGSGQ